MAPDVALRLIEAAIGETVRVAFGAGGTEVELTLAGDAEMTRLNFDHVADAAPPTSSRCPLHEWVVEPDGSRPSPTTTASVRRRDAPR